VGVCQFVPPGERTGAALAALHRGYGFTEITLPGRDLSEIDWSRYPLIAETKFGRQWLQIQRDLGLAQNTVEAYGHGLEDYLRFVRALQTDPMQANGEIIAGYIHNLRGRPGATRGNVISIDSHSALSNATLQLRLTAIRLFYDFLLEEGLCEKNPVGRGRYSPGKAFGSVRERGLIPRRQRRSLFKRRRRIGRQSKNRLGGSLTIVEYMLPSK